MSSPLVSYVKFSITLSICMLPFIYWYITVPVVIGLILINWILDYYIKRYPAGKAVGSEPQRLTQEKSE